jgi:hypothetical protein
LGSVKTPKPTIHMHFKAVQTLPASCGRRGVMLTQHEARRIASNIAKLPTFLAAQSHEE